MLVRKKTKGEITQDDDIVLESWVWISDEGNIIFDSTEKLSDDYNKLIMPFLKEYAARTQGKRIPKNSEL